MKTGEFSGMVAWVAMVQAVVLSVLFFGILWRWRPHLRIKPMLIRIVTGIDTEVRFGAQLEMKDYLWLPMSRLVLWFGLAWLFWTLMYWQFACIGTFVPALLDLEQFRFINHLLTNITTLFFMLFFFELAAPKSESVRRREFTRVMRVGWLFIALAVLVLELMGVFRYSWMTREPMDHRTYGLIYGLGQSLAMFLVLGRLEDVTIMDHLRRTRSRAIVWWYPRLVVIGYLYAALQPLYPYLMDATYERLQVVLIWLSLAMKGGLLIQMDILFHRSNSRNSVSAMRHFLYEVERFTYEELGSYARSFARRFSLSQKRSGAHERASGFLGIEYAYLNDFKREHLMLLGASGEHLGGMLVKEVYANSDASTQGLRVGDYITHIDQVPVSRNVGLDALLKDALPDEMVELKVLRRYADGKEASSHRDYATLYFTVRLGKHDEMIHGRIPDGALARLGIEFLFDNKSYGAVCAVIAADGRKGEPCWLMDRARLLEERNRLDELAADLNHSINIKAKAETGKLIDSKRSPLDRWRLRLRQKIAERWSVIFTKRIGGSWALHMIQRYFMASCVGRHTFVVKGVTNLDRGVEVRTPDVHMLRAVVELMTPGERVQLRLVSALGSEERSSPLTLLMAEDDPYMHSFGPADRRELEFVQSSPERQARLIGLYPDRFAPLNVANWQEPDALGLDSVWNVERVYVLGFDMNHARLFEFVCEARDFREKVERLPIWYRLDRSAFRLFVGIPCGRLSVALSGYPVETIRFREGHFFECHDARGH